MCQCDCMNVAFLTQFDKLDKSLKCNLQINVLYTKIIKTNNSLQHTEPLSHSLFFILHEKLSVNILPLSVRVVGDLFVSASDAKVDGVAQQCSTVHSGQSVVQLIIVNNSVGSAKLKSKFCYIVLKQLRVKILLIDRTRIV